MNESSTVREVKLDKDLSADAKIIGGKLLYISDYKTKDRLAELLLEMKDVYSRLDIAWRKA